MKPILLLFGTAFFLSGLIGCNSGNKDMMPKEGTMSTRGIIEVQEAHMKSLMAVPGVVGVYIGAKDDGSHCIRVMVEKKTNEIDKKIPASLEGYPVEIEVTGKIEPLDSTQ